MATKGSGHAMVKVEGCVFGYPRTGSLDGDSIIRVHVSRTHIQFTGHVFYGVLSTLRGVHASVWQHIAHALTVGTTSRRRNGRHALSDTYQGRKFLQDNTKRRSLVHCVQAPCIAEW